MANEKALDAFLRNVSRATDLAQALEAHISNHLDTDPDEVNWGHVGSAGKAVEDLEALCKFLGLKV